MYIYIYIVGHRVFISQQQKFGNHSNMVVNPFRSTKWRHRSTTIEMKDEESIQNKVTPPLPSQSNSHYTPSSSAAISPSPPPPPKSKKHVKDVPFNSDSILNGIGDYIFDSPLGDGKFSKVMLAHHYSTGSKVAIKVYIYTFVFNSIF